MSLTGVCLSKILSPGGRLATAVFSVHVTYFKPYWKSMYVPSFKKILK